jgi:putative cardiolipin synthase
MRKFRGKAFQHRFWKSRRKDENFFFARATLTDTAHHNAGMMKKSKRNNSMAAAFLALGFCIFLVTPLRAGAEMKSRENPLRLTELLQAQQAGKNGLSGAQLLEKGEEALLARAWLVDHAESTIDVQYFIWSTDNIGILAAESLLRAAQRGVRVRVIVDDLLIDAPDHSMLALADHPNIEIKIYNPQHSLGVSRPRRIYNMLTDFRLFNQRMHDKTLIVDRSVAITGGRNMADEYFDYNQQYNFRDRDILLIGPVAHDLESNFEAFWHSPLTVDVKDILLAPEETLRPEETQEVYGALHGYAANPENFAEEVRAALDDLPKKFPALINALVWGEVEFIHDIPGKNAGMSGLAGGGQTTQRLTHLVEQATRSVTIQSPYLVMPEGGIEFFRKLVERGVEVRIITNSLAATDNLHAFSGYSKQRKKILKAGIKVYEFKPQPQVRKVLIDRLAALEKTIPIFAIHAKTMVVDGTTLFVGTFNLDPRSANLNTEVGVLIENMQLAAQVEQTIAADMLAENSWDAGVDKPDRKAPFAKRLKIKFWKLFPLEPLL